MNQPVPVRFVPHPASLCGIALGHLDRRLEEISFGFGHPLATFQDSDFYTIFSRSQIIADSAGSLGYHRPDHGLAARKILVIAETYGLFPIIRKALRINAAAIAISRGPDLRPEIDLAGIGVFGDLLPAVGEDGFEIDFFERGSIFAEARVGQKIINKLSHLLRVPSDGSNVPMCRL